jgi:hypothetical protein
MFLLLSVYDVDYKGGSLICKLEVPSKRQSTQSY